MIQPQQQAIGHSPSSDLSASNPLDSLAVACRQDMGAVNAIILERMQSDIPLIPELAGHLIAAGGKRIRPLLTLAIAAAYGYKGTRQHALAACVEFIHTATLLHDDVVDESDQRRGRASANAVFGNEAAVLVGDFLFSRAFQVMVEDGSLDVLRILSNASAVIAEGEVLQLSTANDIATTEAQYLQVISAKTAALFAAACEVGGVVAGQGAERCAAMRDYGCNLGIAFQIADDVLDYAARTADMGKSAGDDFKEGKMTLPVIRAHALGTAEEQAFWARVMQAPETQKPEDFQTALDLMNKYDALSYSLDMARGFARKGKDALAAGMDDVPLRHDLSALISFAVDRGY